MDESVRSSREASVFRRVVIPFATVALLNCVILLVLLLVSGTFKSMYESGLNILGETARNKYQMLESNMLDWMSFGDLDTRLCHIIEKELAAQGKTVDDMAEDPALNAQLVNICKDELLSFLQISNHSGVFIILNGMGVPDRPESRAGVYFGDTDPSSYIADKSDMYLMRGLPPLSRELGITLNSYWQASFTFEGGAANPVNDYYYKPLLAYKNRTNTGTPARYYGYWAPVFQLDPNDGNPIITYSQTLAVDGTVYGVIGCSVNMTELKEAIGVSAVEAIPHRNSYCVAITQDEGESYQIITASGEEFLTNFYDAKELRPVETYEVSDYSFAVFESENTKMRFYAAVCPIKLYVSNTPFENMQWVLLGMQNMDQVFAMETRFRISVLTAVLLSLFIGIIIALWSASGISHPITRLMKDLKAFGPDEPVSVRGTGIREVDELAQTIMKQKQDAVEEASRISKIISLAGLPIGTFEKREDTGDVFCSDDFFTLLDCQPTENAHNRLSAQRFEEIIEEKLGDAITPDELVFEVKDSEPPRYVRMQMMVESKRVLGTLMDVTDELESRKRLEHERDYDLLTNLLNRRAFEEKMTVMFNTDADELHPVSALVMIDLDNLKTVNDSNGHENGDLYIQGLATALRGMRMKNCLLGRRSGDEFYMFCYGYNSRSELSQALQKGWRNIQQQIVTFSDGQKLRLHASGGIAWYPDDTTDFRQLLHYADFAMYRVKNAVKGEVQDFNRDDYRQTGYMVNGIQALNRMLDQTLVRYAYQPLVSARDGSIMGYEMLMRPQVEELSSPLVVLNLAKEQGMLHFVESMTWRAALQDAEAKEHAGAITVEQKLFINTITNQNLDEDEEAQLFERYKDIMPRVVMEMTENENPNDSTVKRKIDMMRKQGAKIAIDDFGSGYNSDISLITFSADYVKLDIDFIRNIHLERDKRSIVVNTIKYAHQRGILIIAEGVECVEELRTLATLGVDYFQGYYLARPAFEPPTISPEIEAEIKKIAHKSQNMRGGGAF